MIESKRRNAIFYLPEQIKAFDKVFNMQRGILHQVVGAVKHLF
jgi:hypothetical protein